MTTQRTLDPSTIVAFFLLAACGVGFFLLESLSSSRFLILPLLAGAAALVFTGRDRLLFALLGVYLGSDVLFSLLVNDVLPVWVVFILLAGLAGFLLAWLAAAPNRLTWLLGFAGGIFTVELIWFLTSWPFDPRSKAAVITLFFYGLWILFREVTREKVFRVRDWVVTGLWLSVVLTVILWFADWQA